jgi:hypothetical protein
MASGAMTPAPPITTQHPIVNTRKKVPMNSTTYLFIVVSRGLSVASLLTNAQTFNQGLTDLADRPRRDPAQQRVKN